MRLSGEKITCLRFLRCGVEKTSSKLSGPQASATRFHILGLLPKAAERQKYGMDERHKKKVRLTEEQLGGIPARYPGEDLDILTAAADDDPEIFEPAFVVARNCSYHFLYSAISDACERWKLDPDITDAVKTAFILGHENGKTPGDGPENGRAYDVDLVDLCRKASADARKRKKRHVRQIQAERSRKKGGRA